MVITSWKNIRGMNMKRINMKRYFAELAVIVICLCGPAFAAPTGSDLLVDTKFVMDKIGKPGWVFLDMRFSDDFSQGHIPGAVLLPPWVLKTFIDDTKRQATVLPRMEQTLGELGIGNDSHVIVYGEPTDTGWNTVMFWVMETVGCNSGMKKCTVQYYDGGMERWKAEGGTLEQVESKPKPVSFKGVAGAKRGVKIDEVLRIVDGKQKAVFLDVRKPEEYDGIEVQALRGGHIPRAVNIDYRKNFDAGTSRMLPLDQLRDLYKTVPKDQRVITYCQTGGRGAYTYLVLRALGYLDVAVYHDGWRVYGSDMRLPVEDETWYNFGNVNRGLKAIKELQEKVK
jgi:thiosulfate/3-mercaptopyruvate sulfurtransferase